MVYRRARRSLFFTAEMAIGFQLFSVGILCALGGFAMMRLSAQDERQHLDYLMRLNEAKEDKELLRALIDLPHGIAYWIARAIFCGTTTPIAT